jgi:hypothetical protein
MSELGQKAKYSLRADVFRFAPINGHRQTGPVGLVRAMNGSGGYLLRKEKAARRRLFNSNLLLAD